LIKSGFNIDANILDRCRSIGFTVENTRFAFASISISENIYGEQSEHILLKQTRNVILNIFADFFSERSIEYIYTQLERKYILFLSSDMLIGNELKRILTALMDSVSRYFDCSLSIVYSAFFDEIKDAPDIFKRFMEKEQILFYTHGIRFFIADADSISFTELNVFDLKNEYNRQIIEAIGQENKEKTKKLIHEVSSFFSEKKVNPRIVKIFYSNLLGDIFSSYGGVLENNKELQNHEYYHYQIQNSGYQQNIMHLFIVFTGKVINEIQNMRNVNSKVLVNRALNYIKYHYDEKISLDDVASELHISKQYLANAFKKATGENMSLYINKLRIEKAKRMLLQSDGRIKEIFEDVGYSNQQYFSKVFKKITGMTIMEYKESMINKK
jgi:two-component system response regulator YesN